MGFPKRRGHATEKVPEEEIQESLGMRMNIVELEEKKKISNLVSTVSKDDEIDSNCFKSKDIGEHGRLITDMEV